jgi:valyl-tRNA synthetase
MRELPKAYDPSAIEKRWAEYWLAEKLFAVPTPQTLPVPKKRFVLLLPPPNVTGRLHMGHMLNQTEMDIIIRWHRMRGDLTLWVPGTDHAGIATQMMVERQLAGEGVSRQSLGREKFVERVWRWREEYGGAILEQMKRLGVSVDWSREYFTMDDGLSRAVREAFVRLYEARDERGQRLIYRGKYIVNWCPRCGTAISDLEVLHEETLGKLYEIRYPVSGSQEFVTVATTRPETMLGDAAIAVNPGDERYRHLHGKKVILPLMQREIPIILDELAKPEFGTGAVKVTPAHDPNDFQAGLRHNLPQIDVMDEGARMNQNAGPYAGLDRFEARDRVLRDLQEQGLLASVKDHTLSLGKCARCQTIVEPRLSTQWFVRIAPLAERAIRVVEAGDIRFTPENYRTIYLNWMRNIYDWCISRQLWWGHRIPAWHCLEPKCGEITVARETPKKCGKCGGEKLQQDTDVLDTWFSSALLPFTVFGWPEKTKDLEIFYPTSLLITGYDILFFWVARMIMMGCWFMGGEGKLDVSGEAGRAKLKQSVPFREVYIHALVRDAERQKMSKTKGNVVDPIEITEKYGTDAVRFTLASMASPGTDIALSEDRIDGYRKFANKIWNAARFIFMNVERAEKAGAWQREDYPAGPVALSGLDAEALEDRWILGKASLLALELRSAVEEYRFDDAANKIYGFFWGDFCDWYLEIIKLRLSDMESDPGKASAKIAVKNLLSVFENCLRFLSPLMPFICEELWQAVTQGNAKIKSVALAGYPEAWEVPVSDETQSAMRDMAVLQNLVVTIRELRAKADVPGKQAAPIRVYAVKQVISVVRKNAGLIQKLAGVAEIHEGSPQQNLQGWHRSTPEFDVELIYEKQIDSGVERARLIKELSKLEAEFSGKQKQLSNEGFLGKAPAEVVEGLRKRADELNILIAKTRQALHELGLGGAA